MEKDFQIAILKECARIYPSGALQLWNTLLGIAPGDTPEEKLRSLVAHLSALDEAGYIQGFCLRASVDGYLSCNHNFTLTAQGLLAAGENVLHPDPCEGIREALLEQIQAVRALSPQEKTSVKSVLSSLPKAALERLRDKGLDALLGFLFP